MENTNAVPVSKRFYFEWLFPFLFRPRAHARQVAQKRATWLTPLLVVSLLMVARLWFTPAISVSVPVDVTPLPMQPGAKGMITNTYAISAHLGGGGGGGGGGVIIPPPGSMDPGSAELPAASATDQIVPIAASLVGLWAGWFLLSVLLYVGMVISGSSNSFTETLNLVGWSSLPLGIRQVPLLITALSLPSAAANSAGLASLLAITSGPTGFFLSALLKLVDVYLVWQIILILLGLGQISPLPVKRVLGITLGAVALFLVIAAMPGFLSSIFAQLTQPVPGMY